MTLCVICLNYLDKDLVVGPCGHPFHEKCIFGWIRIKPSCPNCVQKLNARMLCRLHIEPLQIFKDIVKDPSKFKELPEEVRGQVCAPKSSTAGNEATAGEDKNANGTIHALRDKIGEQHEKLSTCLTRLSKLEAFQKDAIDTRAKLEERVSSLDLMKQQLDNTVVRMKRKSSELEKENKELKHLTKTQGIVEKFMGGEDISLSELLDEKSPAEQTALLFPMVHQLREENEKIRRNHIEMENRLDADKAAELAKSQELRAELKEMQTRLIKSEAKRDRYKQRLGKLNKDKLELRKKLENNPPILIEKSGITITPGNIEQYSTENKRDTQHLSLNTRVRAAAPLKKLHPYNPRLMNNKAAKAKGTTRKFGFGSALKFSSSRISTASISSGFDGRGGSSKVLINKLKKRRLGNSLF